MFGLRLGLCAALFVSAATGDQLADNRFVETIHLRGLLSFSPDSEPFDLQPLNVLIGPNGAGKSNLLEAFDLLHRAPDHLVTAIRDGGTPGDWIWKGAEADNMARIEAIIGPAPTGRSLRYKLAFTEANHRLEVTDEAIEEVKPVNQDMPDVRFYYRFNKGRPMISVPSKGKDAKPKERHLERDSLAPDESVLSQRKDPDLYPELTWTGKAFGEIVSFREWSFGRGTALRKPQSANDPIDQLMGDARNLALVLNEIEHRRGRELDDLVRRFLPRFRRLSTRILGGTVQFHLHEDGLDVPIPATRLSDGTIRFLAILAALLAPTPPRLLCIEEPELGLHPDALGLLAEMLVEASSRMQIVVTTHSDVLISALSDQVQSVVVCENPGDGTVLRRLEADRLTHWLGKYRLGDIWRIGQIGGNL
jgi:predicted ATPase